jgi:hypothetical protein
LIDQSFTHASPSITATIQAQKEGITDLTAIQNQKSELKTRCLILLPPFIAKALMVLPTLSCAAVFETVMSTIAAYDKEQKIPAPINTSADTPNEGNTPGGEFEDDPIKDPDKDDFVEVPVEKAKSKSAKPSATSKGTSSTKKRTMIPSTFTKFCFFA